MGAGSIHTVYRDGSWSNEIEDKDSIAWPSFATKQEAVAAGRIQAIDAKTDHVIHNVDGTISERNSYAKDRAALDRGMSDLSNEDSGEQSDSPSKLLSPASQLGRLAQTGGTPEAGVQPGNEPTQPDGGEYKGPPRSRD